MPISKHQNHCTLSTLRNILLIYRAVRIAEHTLHNQAWMKSTNYKISDLEIFLTGQNLFTFQNIQEIASELGTWPEMPSKEQVADQVGMCTFFLKHFFAFIEIGLIRLNGWEGIGLNGPQAGATFTH